MPNVPHDPNDLAAPGIAKVDGQPFADRILVREKASREAVADDDHALAVSCVLFCKDAAAQYWNADGAKVIRARNALVRIGSGSACLRSRNQSPFHSEPCVVLASAQRQFCDGSRSSDSGQMLNALDQLAK